MTDSKRNRFRCAALAGVAVAALAPIAAADAAVPKVRKAAFAVTVDGIQRNSWSNNHKAAGIGGCDTDYTSHGTEKVRFTSSKFTMHALMLPGLSAPVLTIKSGSKPTFPQFRLRGTVTRSGDIYIPPNDAECGGPDGGGGAAKDCGTKSFSGLRGTMDYRTRSKPRDQLEMDTLFGKDPFGNCPAGGVSFPTLLTKNGDREMDLRLPRGELFDKKLGKLILIGRGRDVVHDGEYDATTRSRWVITLVRK